MLLYKTLWFTASSFSKWLITQKVKSFLNGSNVLFFRFMGMNSNLRQTLSGELLVCTELLPELNLL